MLNGVIQLPEYQFPPSDKDEWLRETKNPSHQMWKRKTGWTEMDDFLRRNTVKVILLRKVDGQYGMLPLIIIIKYPFASNEESCHPFLLSRSNGSHGDVLALLNEWSLQNQHGCVGLRMHRMCFWQQVYWPSVVWYRYHVSN